MKTEIEIPVSDLKSTLPGLAKIVGRARSLPVLGCIKVALDSERQNITLQAHNLDEIATVRLPNQSPGLRGELLVSLEALTGIVKRCSNDQVIRLCSNGKETKIQYAVAGSRQERSVEYVPLADWPEVRVIDSDSFDLDETFKSAIKEALECASETSSRPVLNGACLDVRNKDAHYVIGTDGHHLYSANTFQFHLAGSLIVPSHKFVCWPMFMNDGQWKLRMSSAVKSEKGSKTASETLWLQIDSERWSYLARAIEGEFPNWKHVVPKVDGGWTRVEVQPDGMEAMLEAIPLLPGADLTDQPVSLEVGVKGLTLRAQGREEKDQTRVPIAGVRVIGKPVRVSVNRKYLDKALRFGFASIQILDQMSPIVFTREGKTMVVMPLRGLEAEAHQAGRNIPPSHQENSSAATPSAAEETTTTETIATQERPDTMQATTPTAAPGRGNLQIHNGNKESETEETRSAFKAALEQVDGIKSKLRDVMADLTETMTLLKTAEKEQRLSLKEIETFRAKLREIQNVSI